MKSCDQPQKYRSCVIQGDKGIGCLPGEQLKSARPNFSGAANICTVQPSGAAGLHTTPEKQNGYFGVYGFWK